MDDAHLAILNSPKVVKFFILSCSKNKFNQKLEVGKPASTKVMVEILCRMRLKLMLMYSIPRSLNAQCWALLRKKHIKVQQIQPAAMQSSNCCRARSVASCNASVNTAADCSVNRV